MKSRVVKDELKIKAFLESVEDVTWQAVAAVLYAFHLEGYRKQRLQRVFSMIKSVYDMPRICGKELCGNDLMEFLKQTYDIDVKQISPKTDSEYNMMKEAAKQK